MKVIQAVTVARDSKNIKIPFLIEDERQKLILRKTKDHELGNNRDLYNGYGERGYEYAKKYFL